MLLLSHPPAMASLARFPVHSRFNKIAIHGTPQMAVDKEARAYRESIHTILSVTRLNYILVYSVLEHINTPSIPTISG